MAFNSKALADGQLANTKTTMYTASSVTTTGLHLTLVNTDSSARTCNVYIKPGSTSRRIIPKDMSMGAGESYIVREIEGHTLENGDLIEADASTAAVIDFVLSGVEKS